jgi:hypothetical protein
MFGFDFDVEEDLGLLSLRLFFYGEEVSNAACPPFLPVLVVAGKVGGGLT